VPEDALHPAITHEATRRLLTEGGLPGAHSLMRFAPPAAPRAATVRQYLLDRDADPAGLDPYIAGLVVVGWDPAG
jgi:hypothetical protein